jgi:hypothetical protein
MRFIKHRVVPPGLVYRLDAYEFECVPFQSPFHPHMFAGVWCHFFLGLKNVDLLVGGWSRLRARELLKGFERQWKPRTFLDLRFGTILARCGSVLRKFLSGSIKLPAVAAMTETSTVRS